jgi:hypothetical protein
MDDVVYELTHAGGSPVGLFWSVDAAKAAGDKTVAGYLDAERKMSKEDLDWVELCNPNATWEIEQHYAHPKTRSLRIGAPAWTLRYGAESYFVIRERKVEGTR